MGEKSYFIIEKGIVSITFYTNFLMSLGAIWCFNWVNYFSRHSIFFSSMLYWLDD